MAKIYNYFSNYINDEDLAYIGSGEITRFTVYKSDRRLELDILMDRLLDYQVVSRCRTALKNALDLNEAVINIKYFKSLFDIDNIEKILSFIVADNPVVNGFFEGVEAEEDDGVITLCLKHGGRELLESQNMDKVISRYLYDKFEADYDISFLEVKSFDMEAAVRQAVQEKAAQKAKQEEEKEKYVPHIPMGDLPLYDDTRKIIMGRQIKDMPKPIKDVMPDDGFVTVWGDVVKTDTRDTKRGDSRIFSFDITDYTSSISAKIFEKNSVIDPIIKNIESAGTVIINSI